MRAYGALGIDFVQGWGMTEVFPGATMVTPSAMADTDDGWRARTSAGRISPLYEMRVVADDGTELPRDGVTVGELEIRGPVVASSYLGSEVERGQVSRRLVADRGRRDHRCERVGADHRSAQGRDQVRGRVDQLPGSGVGADGAPVGP